MNSKTIAIFILFGSSSAQDLISPNNTIVTGDGAGSNDSAINSTSVYSGQALSTNGDGEEALSTQGPCSFCENGTPFYNDDRIMITANDKVLDRCDLGSDRFNCKS